MRIAALGSDGIGGHYGARLAQSRSPVTSSAPNLSCRCHQWLQRPGGRLYVEGLHAEENDIDRPDV
jgi:hypothetical protein